MSVPPKQATKIPEPMAESEIGDYGGLIKKDGYSVDRKKEAAPAQGRDKYKNYTSATRLGQDQTSNAAPAVFRYQSPSSLLLWIAGCAALVWVAVGSSLYISIISFFLKVEPSLSMVFSSASILLGYVIVIVAPLSFVFALTIILWRAQELRLSSLAVVDLGSQLVKADDTAIHSAKSLLQAVRGQLVAIEDALSSVIQRGGKLDEYLHNEISSLEDVYVQNEARLKGLISNLSFERERLLIATERASETLSAGTQKIAKNAQINVNIIGEALERSYAENKDRIRTVISDLAAERDALANNSERVYETLRGIGTHVTREISAASDRASLSMVQATSMLADTLASRGNKITAAVTAAGAAIDEKLAERGARITEQLVKHGAQAAEKLHQSGLEVTRAVQETSDRAAAAISAKGNNLVASVMSMSERVGREIPVLLERLGVEQQRLTAIIEDATRNLAALDKALAEQTEVTGTSLEAKATSLHAALSEQREGILAALATCERATASLLAQAEAIRESAGLGHGADASGDHNSGAAEKVSGRYTYSTDRDAKDTQAAETPSLDASSIEAVANAIRSSNVNDLKNLKQIWPGLASVYIDTELSFTLLHLAASRASLGTIIYLIDEIGCDPAVRDIHGRTPADIADFAWRENEVIEALTTAEIVSLLSSASEVGDQLP